jgi:flagellar biogenesis protein FliO
MLLEVGRMLLSLALVLGLIWGIGRVGRGRQLKLGRPRSAGALGPAQPIEVVGKRSLGRNSAILLVRAGNRTMVLGQTAQQINVLAECQPGPPGQADPSGQADQADGGDTQAGPNGTAPRGGHEDAMPGLASETGVVNPTAWDAIVDRLREMTVRH